MLPYTPPVDVVYVDIGVDVNAVVLDKDATDEPSKYKDNRFQQFRKAYVEINVQAGKLNVEITEQFAKALVPIICTFGKLTLVRFQQLLKAF